MKSLLLHGMALFTAWLLATCTSRPIPPAQVSPLMQPASPLVAAAEPVSTPQLLIMPVRTASAPVDPANVCGLNSEAQAMATLLINGDWQRRDSMTCDLRLVWAAQARADDMMIRRWFGHDSPEGVTPNEHVQLYGCQHDYGPGNHIESIAGGYMDAQSALDALLDSEHHRNHLAGESDWFREQRGYGVGFAQHPEYPSDTKFVIIILNCE